MLEAGPCATWCSDAPVCRCPPHSPSTTRACACTCTRVLCARLHVCARMHSGWGERTNHARTDARACARDPPCAADAKNQCEAQMKYRMERKEMRRPHQAVLPRMPVMPTVRGTTNQPVDVLYIMRPLDGVYIDR